MQRTRTASRGEVSHPQDARWSREAPLPARSAAAAATRANPPPPDPERATPTSQQRHSVILLRSGTLQPVHWRRVPDWPATRWPKHDEARGELTVKNSPDGGEATRAVCSVQHGVLTLTAVKTQDGHGCAPARPLEEPVRFLALGLQRARASMFVLATRRSDNTLDDDVYCFADSSAERNKWVAVFRRMGVPIFSECEEGRAEVETAPLTNNRQQTCPGLARDIQAARACQVAARAERDGADRGVRDRRAATRVEDDSASARPPPPDCSSASAERAPLALPRVDERPVRGVVAFQAERQGAARQSRDVLLIAGKGFLKVEELDRPHMELLRLPLADVQVTQVPGQNNAFHIHVTDPASHLSDGITAVLPNSEGCDRWIDALGSLGVPVPQGWRPLSPIFDDGIPCALHGKPPPIRWVS